MLFSLSELAFVLLLLAVIAGVVVFGYWRASELRAAELAHRKEELEAEVGFLQDQLEELAMGNVPCWRRPDGVISFLIGTLTVPDEQVVTVLRAGQEEADARTVEDTDGELEQALHTAIRQEFAGELRYAAENRCYLRIAVRNLTDSFAPYRRVVEVINRTGIVPVGE